MAAARESPILLCVSQDTEEFTKVDLTDSFLVLSLPSLFEETRCLSLPRKVTQPHGSRHSVYTLTRNIQAWSHHPNPVNLFPGEAYAMSMSGGDICTHIGFLSLAVTNNTTKNKLGEERLLM